MPFLIMLATYIPISSLIKADLPAAAAGLLVVLASHLTALQKSFHPFWLHRKTRIGSLPFFIAHLVVKERFLPRWISYLVSTRLSTRKAAERCKLCGFRCVH